MTADKLQKAHSHIVHKGQTDPRYMGTLTMSQWWMWQDLTKLNIYVLLITTSPVVHIPLLEARSERMASIYRFDFIGSAEKISEIRSDRCKKPMCIVNTAVRTSNCKKNATFSWLHMLVSHRFSLIYREERFCKNYTWQWPILTRLSNYEFIYQHNDYYTAKVSLK